MDVKLNIKRKESEFSNVDSIVTDIMKERFTLNQYMENLKDLNSPFLFKDMEIAVEKYTKAVEEGKNICHWGDFDVDGITTMYLSYNLGKRFIHLKDSSSKISYYIPSREKEGYGVNNEGLLKLKEQGFDLIVTGDCGIASTKQVEYGKSIGLDFIITDHHEYPEVAPDAPIINPHDGEYPFHGLCGCGTMFKFMEALYEYNSLSKQLVYQFIDIVAIATVADLMPLLGENRILVRYGLILLQNNYAKKVRPWLNALLDASKFRGKIDSFTIGFGIGPRLNSIGRLSEGRDAVEFMLSEDQEFLMEKALEIEGLNNERKELQEDVVLKGVAEIESKGVKNATNIIVESRVGVIGLAASNLLERYYRPTTVFTRVPSKPGLLKASARSIAGFDYFNDVLEKTRDILEGGGGHAAAAGLSIKEENFEEFDRRVNEYVAEKLESNPELLVKVIDIDCEFNPHSVNVALIEKLKAMEPYGMANLKPIFFMRNMSIQEVEVIPKPKYNKKGENKNKPKHLQLTLFNGSSVFKAMIFKRADLLEELRSMHTIDIAFTADIRDYGDITEVQLLIEYYRKSENKA